MPTLEFCLPTGELTALLRRPVFARRGGRAAAASWVWHDTADGALAADQVSLCEAKSGWRLERSAPRPGEAWPPATPAPVIAQATARDALGPLPAPLMPIAGFQGTRRVIRLASEPPATMTVTAGVLRGVTQEQPVCRVALDGTAETLAALSMDWAATVPLAIPPCSLAAEAMALARGAQPRPRRSGGPQVQPGTTVADAIVLVVGHLTDVILGGVAAVSDGASAEPVHAMRVALRRLRSAVSVFRRVADGPALLALKTQLSLLARVLGEARDWDVFLAETGQDVSAALPDDQRIQLLLNTAGRQRESAYAALRREFASPAFRQLVMGLVQFAALQPWAWDADAERRAQLDADIAGFAADVLTRQHRHVMSPGPDIGTLPIEDLHTLRKLGKRLRYTSEFFADLYPHRRTERFLRRLSQLQTALGLLNDGAAAATLMQGLRGGPDRQFAAGAVQGFTAARTMGARTAIEKSWDKFRAAKPFWT